MTKLSMFDFTNNAPENGYRFFALDYDAPNTHTGGNSPTRVIVIKTDKIFADIENEKFYIKFNLINQRYKYLRLKAILSTTDTSVSPSLDSYLIKLGD